MVRAAMTGIRGGSADQQGQTVAWLRGRVAVVEAECQAVRAERDRLAGAVERLTVENQRLSDRVGELVARWRSCGGRASARPPRSPRTGPYPTPDGLVASLGRRTGGMPGGRSPIGLTGSWWSGCRTCARHAVARSPWSGWP